MGANGNRKQEKCHRGHLLIEPNVKSCQNGGRRCRACECALSAAHNAKVRHGNDWDAIHVQQYADSKYRDLVHVRPATVGTQRYIDSGEYEGEYART